MCRHTERINPLTPVALLTDTHASSSTLAVVSSATLVGNQGFRIRAKKMQEELMPNVWGQFRTQQRRQWAQSPLSQIGCRLQAGQVEGSGLGDCRRVAPLLPRALIHPACTGLNAKSRGLSAPHFHRYHPPPPHNAAPCRGFYLLPLRDIGPQGPVNGNQGRFGTRAFLRRSLDQRSSLLPKPRFTGPNSTCFFCVIPHAVTHHSLIN